MDCPMQNKQQIPKSLIHRVAEILGVDNGQKSGKHTQPNVGRNVNATVVSPRRLETSRTKPLVSDFGIDSVSF